MGNYEQLKQSVSDVIKTNGNQEITGSILQNVLLTIISTVGANATFAGIATPTTNPGTPDQNVFYIASEAGTYTNFGNIELQNGLSVLMSNGPSWVSHQMLNIDDVPTAGSDNLVKSGGVYTKIKAIEDAGYIFAGIATPATNPGTPDGSVFYLASESGTYTNFNAIELQDGLSVLTWNGSWSSQQIFGVDDEPTVGSDNLVKSGGVQEELALGAVYDVSAKNPTAGVNNDGKFESLSALLGDTNLDTLIPVSARKGGMSIKFVQSSDNKYKRFNLFADAFTTDVTKWQGSDILTEISDTYIDLEIKDENNNLLAQFYNGHVRTKNFDSAKSVTKDELNQEIDKLQSIENGIKDLDIKDENGNVIAQFYDGNIKTKNFDSNEIVLKNSLKGKRVGILGDSISSYRGLIPSGYVGWYPTGDVTDSSQMWFGIVRDLLEVDITNCSWAGSKVCGNSGNTSAEAGCSTKRISDLAANGTPDVVICYIGINDFGDSDITMGEWNNTNEIPSEGTITNFANAYAIMVNKIMSTYPMAKVYCCTLLETRQNDVDNNKIPTINHHGEALEDWNDIIRKISKYFGAEIIDLHSCGINWYNIPIYAPEDAIHPWADGQKLIGNSIIKSFI